MTDIMASESTFTAATFTFAAAIGVSMLSKTTQYPLPDESYEGKGQLSSYSSFRNSLGLHDGSESFFQQMSNIYSSFSMRQERLDAEFETAIFSDIESLYEA